MLKQEKMTIGVVAVVLLGLATFFDLNISQAIFNEQSLYGRFFEAFGELPGVLVAVFSIAALMVTVPKPIKLLRGLGLAGLGALLVMFSFMAGAMPMTYLGGSTLVSVLSAALYIAAALFLATRVRPEHRAALRRAAVIGLLTFVAAIFIINIIKMGWGRLRFRSMTDPVNQFTMWFIPQGLAAGNEFMSFPSGHSANSSVILWITLLPLFIPQLSGKAVYLKAGAYLWIAMVMFSRVIMGAHFLSDVTMGALISICSFYTLCHLIKDKSNTPNKTTV